MFKISSLAWRFLFVPYRNELFHNSWCRTYFLYIINQYINYIYLTCCEVEEVWKGHPIGKSGPLVSELVEVGIQKRSHWLWSDVRIIYEQFSNEFNCIFVALSEDLLPCKWLDVGEFVLLVLRVH
jgi:hypothetical protein